MADLPEIKECPDVLRIRKVPLEKEYINGFPSRLGDVFTTVLTFLGVSKKLREAMGNIVCRGHCFHRC